MEVTKIPEYFLGCLFSNNFKDLKIEEKQKILIEKGIYVLTDETWCIVSIKNNDKISSEPKNFDLGDNFMFLERTYVLSEKFTSEVYEYLKADAYASIEMHLDINLKQIELEAKNVKIHGDIIEFYKNQHKDYYEEIKKNIHFFIYNEPTAWHYDDWKEFVTAHIGSNKDMIELHLFCEYGYTSFEEICENWQNLIHHSTILTYLEKKINNYNEISLSKLIFKENGEEIFNYIILMYEDDKNQAFFNYLYYFLKDELKKLKLEDEQSNAYKSYVIKKGYLVTYGRMQKARSTNKKTQVRMMNLFYEIYSAKFE
jgi:hypothetical protein